MKRFDIVIQKYEDHTMGGAILRPTYYGWCDTKAHIKAKTSIPTWVEYFIQVNMSTNVKYQHVY